MAITNRFAFGNQSEGFACQSHGYYDGSCNACANQYMWQMQQSQIQQQQGLSNADLSRYSSGGGITVSSGDSITVPTIIKTALNMISYHPRSKKLLLLLR